VTGSEGIAILKNSKHKEAALAFLKFIADKYYQSLEFKVNGQYPTLSSLYADPELVAADTTHTLKKIEDQFQYGLNRPNAPGYVNWSDQLASELHSALMGTETPQKALDSAVAKIKSAIQAANN
jgi:multiple sugar transport system substrate-binding protein